MMTARDIQDSFGSDAAVREDLTTHIVPRVGKYLWKNHGIDSVLHYYSTDILTRIAELYAPNISVGAPGSGIRSTIASLIQSGDSELVVADVLDFVPILNDYNALAIRDAMHGLSHYRRLGWIPERTTSHSDFSYARLMSTNDRIIEILIAYGDDDGLSSPVKYNDGVCSDERLIRLVWDHNEDYQRIINLMEDRSSADFDLLSSILNSEAPALSEGVL